MTTTEPERIPAFVVTGFLGSGKTTLLRQVLAWPELSDSAVIINELGEVALDHQLIAFTQDCTVVLQGGCVCCTIRTDIEQALKSLFSAMDSGTVPAFRRIIIESTGIAEPQPLLSTLLANPLAASRLSKPRVITVVDGILGTATLASHPEAAAQIVAADTIVVSKRDLESEPTELAALGRLNPWARVIHADLTKDDLRDVFTGDTHRLADDVLGGWSLKDRPGVLTGGHNVAVLCLVLDQPLNCGGFGIWMTMLLHAHGAQVLRVKAILDIDGNQGPVVFHCAQHLVHPPEHHDEWPTDDHRSKLVFVVRGLDPELIKRSLLAVQAVAKQTMDVPERDGYLPAGAGGSVSGRPVRRPTTPRWIKG